MADGNLVGRLILTLQLDKLFDGQPLFNEPLFEPVAPRCRTGLCRDKRWQNSATNELDTGRSDFAMSATTTTRWDGFFSAISCRTIHPPVREIAILPGDGQPGGDALQIFNQPQPQHNWNRPQLAQFQGTHGLVSGDEGVERSRINLCIHVRDELEHDVVNSRKSGGRAVHQAGQLPAVAMGQMPPGHLDLLLDQVEVVEKPFGGGSDAPAGTDGEGRAIEGSQDVLVVAQLGQQTVGALPGDYLVIGCESFGMPRQLFDTEQLGPQRRRDCAGRERVCLAIPVFQRKERVCMLFRLPWVENSSP